MYCLCYLIKNNKYIFKRQFGVQIISAPSFRVRLLAPGKETVLGDSPTWCCTMSLLAKLSVNTALGQVQGLVEGPSASALHTLILQSLRLGALLQLGSLWQQLLFIQHDKKLLSCQLCLGLSSFS